MSSGPTADRPRAPDIEGYAERDGVRLGYAVFGSGESTILLLPTWAIIDSRVWKAQVPYLARHFRVVTFDGRGSGRSDRPTRAADYADEHYADDAAAVLDAVGVDKAVVVGYSAGGTWAAHLAARHPDRVLGVLAIAPAAKFATGNLDRARRSFDRADGPVEDPGTFNRRHWRTGGYSDFAAAFFAGIFNEPHSTKQIEDTVRWALDSDPETVVASYAGMIGADGAPGTLLEEVCARVRCPVRVLHGTADKVTPVAMGERLAELTGGDLVRLEGAGHGPMARHPVLVNREIRRFAEAVEARRRPRVVTVPDRRAPRVLYLSSPIGLGHARRDLAIAAELRARRPGVRIDWLTQHPVSLMLGERGESVHPASAALGSESAHLEAETGEHDLHVFGSLRRMDGLLVQNFMVFADLIEAESYDLVVADEAWDVDYFLHENPELKRFAFAWLTDFVGWLPMPDGGPAEAALTADYNAEMLEQRARFRRLRDRSIFVGQPDDIVPGTFGPGLPAIRDWTEENFDFAGYVTGTEPVGPGDRERLRERFGYRRDERICVVAVGGSGVGEPLLRRVLDAVPLARRAVPDLRFVVVAGPRIDPRRLPRRRGARVVGYLPNLDEHLAACDVAIVQGGLTTCMELTAARRPFLYVPLRHHFEQSFHVRRRLEHYRAGTCVDYEEVRNPDALVARLRTALDAEVAYAAVEADGARRAAGMLAELL